MCAKSPASGARCVGRRGDFEHQRFEAMPLILRVRCGTYRLSGNYTESSSSHWNYENQQQHYLDVQVRQTTGDQHHQMSCL